MASDGNGDFTRRAVFQLTGAAFALPALQSSYVENGPMPFTPKFVDLVRNVTSVTGTGPVTLGQAVSGYTSLAATVSAGDQFYYCIQGIDKPAEREVGRGTMQSDGKVARQPIVGSPTNFSTGTKTIALVAAAEWFSKLDSQGAGMGVAANRAELAARDGATAGRAFLAEAGRAGSFIFDSTNLSAKVSIDPAQGLYIAPASDPTGASGAWARRFDGSVNVKWFGAVGDGTTNDGPAFLAALATLKAIASNADGFYYRGSPKLFIPTGHYYLGSNTLDITHTLVIEGESGVGGGTSTKLRWAAGTTGIRVQAYNELALFELPAVGDAPDASVQAYVAAANAGRWKPVPVELALGADPLATFAVTRRAILGVAETMLAARAPMVLDELSTVDVRLANPVSVVLNADWDALMAGANLAVLGDELIQFGRAEQLGAGLYRLSSLLRGRRGTEWATSSHAVGEAFCVVDAAALRLFEISASASGATLTAVAHGISDVAPLPSAARMVGGESLRPPSPCHLRLWREGTNVIAQWVRRSHRGWAWTDGVGVADDPFPELYRLRVSGPSGQLVAETSTSSASFSAADLPAATGQSITLAVAMIGPMAPSREALASLIL